VPVYGSLLQAYGKITASLLQANCRLTADLLQAYCSLIAGSSQVYCKLMAGLRQASWRFIVHFMEAYRRRSNSQANPFFYYIPSLETNGISDTSIKTFKYGQKLDIFGATPSLFFFFS